MDFSKALKDKYLRVKICEKSFKLFLIYYFSDYINYKFAPFHNDVIKDLEDQSIQNLLITMMRETGKTFLVAVAYLTWFTVYKKGSYVIVCSDEEGAAKKVMAKVAYQLQNNKLIIRDFGQLYFETKRKYNASKKKQDGYFETANGITFLARGAGQKVRGALGNDIKRPDLILADDLESLAKAQSLDQRNKLENWFHSEPEAAANQTTGRVIVLANMLHKDSLCIRLKNTGAWKTHWIPVEMDGKLSWPERWTYTEKEAEEFNKDRPPEEWKVSIEKMKQKYGTHVFNREWMLNPLDEGQVIIPEAWIKYYDQEKNWKDRNKFKIVMAIDPAVKVQEHNDFTAIAVMAQEKISKDIYLIDYINRRLTFSQIKENIYRLDRMYLPSAILVEDVAAQNWLIQELKSESQRLPVKGITRKEDKRSRLLSVSITFEHGQVLFRQNQNEVVNQITTFTGTNKDEHDDLVDAVADCIRYFKKPSGLRGGKKRGVL